jgi:rhamnosyltransferase
MPSNIAATVILFNPDISVIKNIKSYCDGVGKVILVDNSTIKDNNLIYSILQLNSNIIYLSNNDNLGIGSALNTAAKYAIENNFKWLLTMDQDSCFEDFQSYLNCFEKIENDSTLAIVAPNLDAKTSKNCEITYPKIVITSGNIINLYYFIELGQFEDKFFIDEIDHDYCLKAIKNNLKIVKFENCYLEHAIGEEEILTSLFLRRKKKKPIHSHLRVYYQTRNRLYMWKLYGKEFPEYFSLSKVIYKVVYKKVLRIIKWENNKVAKLKAIYRGVQDFRNKRYGKY